jgi:hypothetical protein
VPGRLDAAALAGAHCAVHPAESAVFVCQRCGGFACEGCRSSQEPLCLACDARLGDVPQGFDLGWLIRQTASLFIPSLPIVVGFGMLVAGLQLAQSFLPTASAGDLPKVLSGFGSPMRLVFGVLLALVQLLSELTCVGWWAALARGGEPSLPRALLTGTSRLGWGVLLRLMMGLGLGCGTVLLVAPGLFLLAAWSLAVPAMVLGKGPMQALSDSYDLTTAHRWKLLLVNLVPSFFSLVAGIVAMRLQLISFEWRLVPQALELVANMAAHLVTAAQTAACTLAYLRLSGERLPERV